jgi:Zn-dependent peptidase ImmA (M78 family)/predicted secreted protein
MTDRASILNGRKAAAALLAQLQLRREAEATGQVDVFEALTRLDVLCLCRPLKGLLGAYLPPPHHGVLVTTERSPAIQRFTAAHELGHAYLKHRASYDDESVVGRATTAPELFDPQEVEADSFAGAFLAPQWLIARHIKRQSWTADDLRHRANVYQLSLRLGLTYSATAVALVQSGVLNWTDYVWLTATEVRDTKVALAGDTSVPDWKRDVWLIREADRGEALTCGPSDLVIVNVRERAAAGYLWELAPNSLQPFQAESAIDEAAVGGPSNRKLQFWAPEGNAAITLTHARPWETVPQDTFDVRLAVRGREIGYPAAYRNRLAA